MDSNVVQQFILRQLAQWPTAADRTRQLALVITRAIDIGKRTVTLQYNPARRISTAAKTDARAIDARPCFLCDNNRPPEQMNLPWHDYGILLNPFPIFPNHITIVHSAHTPQRIAGRIGHMAMLACELEDFTVFYNGPACGASAPDHMHFQAAPSVHFPVWEAIAENPAAYSRDNISVHDMCPAVYHIEARSTEEMEKSITALIAKMPSDESTGEPKLNILMRRHDEAMQAVVIPRRAHRADNFAHDPADTSKILVSPASVDMAGVVITVRQEDFERLTAQQIIDIYAETGYDYAWLTNILES